MIETAASLASQMVSEAERLLVLCPPGSEEHHEATNALWALRRVQQIVGGFGAARRGQIGARRVDHPKLRLVPSGPLAPVDDPALDV